MTRPYIVGLGGTMRAGSSTESALSLVLGTIAAQGADTLLLCGSDIDLPPYVPGRGTPTLKASRIATELGRADGIILGTPGYHGGISGLGKDCLPFTGEVRGNKKPLLAGPAG